MAVDALDFRRAGLVPRYSNQRQLLERFDASDAVGKRQMLGKYWPTWKRLLNL